MIVTLNPGIREPSDCTPAKLEKILARFREDKNGIQELRQCEPEEQSRRKMELPVVVFGGQFKSRKNSALVKASGLMILDFDCESTAQSEKIREIICDDEYVHAYFRSTRGLGWKALVRIPVVQNDAEYKKYYYALEDYFPDIDPACKDISRACFFTYDPDLAYNPDSRIWEQQKDPNMQKAHGRVSRKTDYSLINRALNLIRYAEVGERHNKILSASRLCGGWVASGRIDYQEAERLLETEAYHADPKDFRTNKRAITDGLDHGMRDPLDEEKFFTEEKVKEKFEKIYWTLTDVWSKVEERWESGIPDGYTTGHTEVDNIYRLHLGYTTYIYGPAFSGKSQVWFEFLRNYSYRHNLKHAIFSPETGTAADIYSKIIEMVAGKDIDDRHGYQMSKEELGKARGFVDKHFIVIDPKEKTMTLDDLVASCQIVERVYDTKIHTLTIDPWNDLDHDMEEDNYREDKYLEKSLKKIRVTAHVNNWHICLITHAKDQAFVGTGEKRYQPPATIREVAGGQAWSRRGFMMASVWRPPSWMERYKDIELEGNETFFLLQKYKPEWSGKKGFAVLRYKPQEHRYYTGKTGVERFAHLDKPTEAYHTNSLPDEVPF